jgi:hypothetical protein
MTRKILVSGLCQTAGMISSLSLMLPKDNIYFLKNLAELSEDELLQNIQSADVLLSTLPSQNIRVQIKSIKPNLEIHFWPQIFFPAFHPDIVMFFAKGIPIKCMESVYNSPIALWSWTHKIPIDRAIKLFNENTLNDLGYLNCWQNSVNQLKKDIEECDLDFDLFFNAVKRQGVFMHSHNHAKLSPIIHLSRQLACKLGASVNFVNEPIEDFLEDPLIFDNVWPVYPAIADALGVQGCFRWKTRTKKCTSLQDYLEISYRDYDQQSHLLTDHSVMPFSSHLDSTLKTEIGR